MVGHKTETELFMAHDLLCGDRIIDTITICEKDDEQAESVKIVCSRMNITIN